MEITCPRCQVRHLIDAPASARARPQRALKFRCSHCGFTFSVEPQAPAQVSEPPRPSAPPGDEPVAPVPAGEPVHMLQSNGQMWPVPDLATLQRWILEHRVTRADLVSNHGLRWQRVGERADLTLFFAAADQLAEKSAAPPPAPSLPLRRGDLPEDEDIYVDASDPRGVPPPPIPVHVGPRDNFVTIIPPEPDAPTVDEHTIARAGFGADPDTQEQTIQSSLRAGDLDPLVGNEPERTVNLRAVRRADPIALPPMDADPDPHDPGEHTDVLRLSPERTESMKPTFTLPVPPLVRPPPPDPIFGDHTLSPLPPPGEFPRDEFDPPSESSASGTSPWVYLGGAAAVVLLLGAGYVVLGGGAEPAGGPEHVDAAPTEGAGQGEGVAAAKPVETKPAEKPVAAEKPAEKPVEAKPVEAKPAEAKPAEAKSVAKPASSPVDAKPAAKPASSPVDAKPAAKPAEKPVARAAPSDGGGGSPKKLVASGWKAIESGEMAKAHGLFSRALQTNPVMPDALYGRGYASEKLGDGVSALTDYCDALASSPPVDLGRELAAGLRRLGKACP